MRSSRRRPHSATLAVTAGSGRTAVLGGIVIGLLVATVVGVLANYKLGVGRTPADRQQVAAAIGGMDEFRRKANLDREEERSTTPML